MVLYGFPIVLICLWLFLIVGPRPIFGYLMISHGFVLFSNSFVMLQVDLNHRPLPDLRLSYNFLWCCLVFLCFGLILIVGPRPIFVYLIFPMVFHCFSYVFDMLLVDFNRRHSPDLRLSYDSPFVFLWFSYVSG